MQGRKSGCKGGRLSKKEEPFRGGMAPLFFVCYSNATPGALDTALEEPASVVFQFRLFL